MTISSTISRWESVGNGSATIFPYTNKIFDDTDLNVYIDSVLQTLTTHYTVSGAGAEAGGNVTFVTAPANGASVVIVRNVANTQLIDFPAGGAFPSVSSEDGLDRRTIISQQINDALARAIRYNEADAGLPSGVLPTLSSLKGRYLRFNSATGAPEAGVFDTGVASRVIDSFAGDGSTTGFTLSAGAVTGAVVDVYVSGIRQFAGTWSVSGTALTFTTAPPPPPSGVTNNIEVLISETVPIGETNSALVAHAAAGTGAASTTVQAKLRETLSVTDYGAVPDIVGDQTTSFVNAVAAVTAVGEISLPEGNYVVDLATIRTAVGTKLIMWTGPGKINGAQTKQLPGLNFDLVGERLTIRNDPLQAGPDDYANFEVYRSANYSGSAGVSAGVNSALRVETIAASTAGSSGTVTPEWAINGTVTNNSEYINAVATSGVAVSNADGPAWAGHFSATDNFATRTNRTVRGIETNIEAVDQDTNARRVVLDVVAKNTTHIYGAPAASIYAGIRVQPESADFLHGIRIDKSFSGSAGYTGIPLVVAADASAQIADFSGDANYGITMRGTYAEAAIRLDDDQRMGWRTNNVVTTHLDATTSRWRIDQSGSERVGFEIDPTPSVYLNGTQVVGLQQSAIANPASSTAGNNAAIISILGALRTHGLIAT